MLLYLSFGHCYLVILWISELAMARTSLVGITYVTDAVLRGAVCLDGTPPAYHLDRGFGSGANNWLIQIEGGGWCNNITTCLARKNMRLGSSEQMAKKIPFSGILNNMQRFNPDFYNWNRVKVRYCDGASFTGDVEAVDPVTNLHFRGARIWTAVIENLLYRGMRKAKNAILSGCSAGGLTAIIHCNGFRTLLPVGARVKCISDAGYFINVRDILGERHMESFFDQVVETHGSAEHLARYCTSRIRPGLCFFPEYVARQIETPLFILNAAYDSWQIRNILAPVAADPEGIWDSCKLDINNCSPDQLRIMQEFRMEMLYSVGRLGRSTKRGLFVDSCYAHCQSELQQTWLWGDSPELANKSIAKAVGDWFYDRSPFQKIDCPFPCNPTCPNRVHL